MPYIKIVEDYTSWVRKISIGNILDLIIYRQTNDMFLILKTEPGTKVV